jgi:hypothetical protein
MINQPGVRIRPCPTGRILGWTRSSPERLSGLATIIQSLRDNKRSVGVHIFEATSRSYFEDEDEDEDEDDDDYDYDEDENEGLRLHGVQRVAQQRFRLIFSAVNPQAHKALAYGTFRFARRSPDDLCPSILSSNVLPGA